VPSANVIVFFSLAVALWLAAVSAGMWLLSRVPRTQVESWVHSLPVILVDPDGTVVWATSRANHLLGGVRVLDLTSTVVAAGERLLHLERLEGQNTGSQHVFTLADISTYQRELDDLTANIDDLAALLHAQDSAYVVVGRTGRVKNASGAAQRLLGDDTLDDTLDELTHAETGVSITRLLAGDFEAETFDTPTGEVSITLRQTELYGEPVGVLSFKQPVTH
jgi:hypothetical protein